MTTQHVDVLIIGAGLSGIGTACQIAGEFPDKTIAVLERRERLGGTWDLFRYPGIRSDSDMFTFGYKFRPWVDSRCWRPVPRSVSTSPTPQRSTASTRRSTTASRSWRPTGRAAPACWTVTALHEATGETSTYTCRFLVGCTGYYNYDGGYLPAFPGLPTVRGSARAPAALARGPRPRRARRSS